MTIEQYARAIAEAVLHVCEQCGLDDLDADDVGESLSDIIASVPAPDVQAQPFDTVELDDVAHRALRQAAQDTLDEAPTIQTPEVQAQIGDFDEDWQHRPVHREATASRALIPADRVQAQIDAAYLRGVREERKRLFDWVLSVLNRARRLDGKDGWSKSPSSILEIIKCQREHFDQVEEMMENRAPARMVNGTLSEERLREIIESMPEPPDDSPATLPAPDVQAQIDDGHLPLGMCITSIAKIREDLVAARAEERDHLRDVAHDVLCERGLAPRDAFLIANEIRARSGARGV